MTRIKHEWYTKKHEWLERVLHREDAEAWPEAAEESGRRTSGLWTVDSGMVFGRLES